jgi:hypothetical protein
MTTPVIRRRKRPIEVDTIQWTGHNEADVQAFTGGPAVFYALDAEDREGSDDPEATATVFDKLHCTWILVYTGQHIVRGVKGEYHPIAEDVLAETYELPADQAALRDRIAEALYAHDHPGHLVPLNETGMEPAYRESADSVLAVLPASVDRAAVETAAPVKQRADLTDAEDPARIDRLRPEFFEHASVESIDSQIRRAQTQQRQWGNRGRTLAILREARVKQKELGEWPAGGAQQPKEAEGPRTVCVCGHTRGEHITVSGRLLCDACDPDSTENLTCTGFKAL